MATGGILLAALVLWALTSRSRLESRPSHRRATIRLSPPVAIGALVLYGVANLVFVLPHLWSSSPAFYATTPGVTALRAAVGDARVGFGGCATLYSLPPATGILIESNIAYGIPEFAAHDTVISRSLFESWARTTGATLDTKVKHGAFCPSIESAAVARHYGVGFVLEPPGAPGPSGTTYVTTIDGEPLYKVPGAGLATLEDRGSPADNVDATAVPVIRPTNSTMRVVTRRDHATTLYVREEAYPGWHVTVDGRPRPFSLFDGVMMKIDLPAGRHVVTLRYLPASFLWGIVVALTTALLLGTWAVVDALGHRRRRMRDGTGAQ